MKGQDPLKARILANQSAARLALLPRWAKDMIRDLTAEIAELEEALSKERKGTDTSWGRGSLGEPVIYLPNGESVDFRLNDERTLGVISCRVTKESGRAFLNVNGGDTILVEPRASNALRVYLQRP